MLTIDFESLALELKDGTVKHVGASNTAAAAKLYDVAETEVRAFGDDRVKLAFADEAGNEVEVALFEAEAAEVAAGLAGLTEASPPED